MSNDGSAARTADILSLGRTEYGPSFGEDSTKIYVAYMRYAEAVADRRQKANSFGFTVNSALAGGTAYLEHLGALLTPLLALAGMILTIAWFRQIGAYRLVSKAKFEVIEAMERQLPVQPYTLEWRRMGAGSDPRRYQSLSRLESVVPLVFFAIHVVALVASQIDWGS